MGKRTKGNPYGIRLIADTAHELASMLQVLDGWYGRTPADRTPIDEFSGKYWRGIAEGWRKEAEARGVQLDKLKAAAGKANDALNSAEQQRDKALASWQDEHQRRLEVNARADRLLEENSQLRSDNGNLSAQSLTAPSIHAHGNTWGTAAATSNPGAAGLGSNDRCRETDDKARRCILAKMHRGAHTAPSTEGTVYWGSTGQVNVPDGNAFCNVGEIGGTAPCLRVKGHTGPHATQANTATKLDAEPKPLQHITPCGAGLWHTSDSDGINPKCQKPVNHPGPHRGTFEDRPVSWMVTSDSNTPDRDNGMPQTKDA